MTLLSRLPQPHLHDMQSESCITYYVEDYDFELGFHKSSPVEMEPGKSVNLNLSPCLCKAYHPCPTRLVPSWSKQGPGRPWGPDHPLVTEIWNK